MRIGAPSLFLLKVYFIFTIVLYPLGFLRSIGVFNTAELIRVIIPIITMTGIAFIVFNEKIRLKIDGYVFLLFVIVVYAFVVGFLRNGEGLAILSGSFTVFSSALIYLIASSDSLNFSNIIKSIKPFMRPIILVSAINIGISYFLVLVLGFGIYLSFGNMFILLPFSYYLVYENKKWLCCCIVLVILGAKVGVICSALVIVAVNFIVRKRKGANISVFILSLLTFFLFVNVVLFSMKDYIPNSASILGRVVQKLQTYNYYHFQDQGNKKINDFGGGRMSEVAYSLKKFNQLSFLPYVTGAGFGFTYKQYYRGEWTENVRNVHVSPVGIMEKIGLPLTVLFYFFWGLTIKRGLYLVKFLDRKERKVIQFLLYFVIGSFVFSFTAYAVFVSLAQWFFMGYINSFYHRYARTQVLTIIN